MTPYALQARWRQGLSLGTFLLAVGLLAAGGTALAQGAATASTPANVAAALRSAGYVVTVPARAAGENPRLTAEAKGFKVVFYFSGCQAEVCTRLTASHTWGYDEVLDVTDLERVNDWNADAYTQAYIGEKTYTLDSTLFIAGGFLNSALRAWVTEYFSQVQEFEDALP